MPVDPSHTTTITRRDITMPTAPEPEFLTLAEAVRMFGVSRRTLDRWVGSGRIPTTLRDDGEVVIRREQLDNMVARRDDLGAGNNGDPAEA